MYSKRNIIIHPLSSNSNPKPYSTQSLWIRISDSNMSGPNMEYVNVAIKGFEASIDRVSKIKDPIIKHTMMLEVVRSLLDISVKLSTAGMNGGIEEHENNIAEKRMQQDRIKQKDTVKDNKSGNDLFTKIVRMEKDLDTKKEIVQVFNKINETIDGELDQISKYIQESGPKYEDDDNSAYGD